VRGTRAKNKWVKQRGCEHQGHFVGDYIFVDVWCARGGVQLEDPGQRDLLLQGINHLHCWQNLVGNLWVGEWVQQLHSC
jgi:hypothetical protein